MGESRPEDRARALTRLAALVLRDQERLALVESQDTGKPLTQARTDAAVCARYREFYGHAVDSYYGVSIPVDEGFHVYTRREPFGVFGHILRGTTRCSCSRVRSPRSGDRKRRRGQAG